MDHLLEPLIDAWEQAKSIEARRSPVAPQAVLDPEARSALQQLHQAQQANNAAGVAQAIREIETLIFKQPAPSQGQTIPYRSLEYKPLQAIDLGLAAAHAWLRLQDLEKARDLLQRLVFACAQAHDARPSQMFAQLAVHWVAQQAGDSVEAARTRDNSQDQLCKLSTSRADYDRARSYLHLGPQLFSSLSPSARADQAVSAACQVVPAVELEPQDQPAAGAPLPLPFPEDLVQVDPQAVAVPYVEPHPQPRRRLPPAYLYWSCDIAISAGRGFKQGQVHPGITHEVIIEQVWLGDKLHRLQRLWNQERIPLFQPSFKFVLAQVYNPGEVSDQLEPGDLVLVDHWRDPQPGQIVVVEATSGSGPFLRRQPNPRVYSPNPNEGIQPAFWPRGVGMAVFQTAPLAAGQPQPQGPQSERPVAALRIPVAELIQVGSPRRVQAEPVTDARYIEISHLQIDRREYAVWPLRDQVQAHLESGSQYLILRVCGDSMDQFDIAPDDFILVRKNEHPENGSLVIAEIQDLDFPMDRDIEGSFTLKQYVRQENAIELRPHSRNPIYQPQIFAGPDLAKLNIRGEALALIKPV